MKILKSSSIIRNTRLFVIIFIIIFLILNINELSSQFSNNKNSLIEESFTYKPGYIISITPSGDKKWMMQIDLLTVNSNWLPGSDSTEYLINSNAKIRNLTVSLETKTYNCNNGTIDSPPDKPYNEIETTAFMTELMTKVGNKEKEIDSLKNHSYYIAFFDISGSKINAIYEQCLP